MTLPLKTFSYYNNSTGLNLRDSPTKVPETDASISLNVDYSVDGAFTTRNGSIIVNAGHQMDQLNGLGMFDYRKSDGTQVNVIQNGSKIYTNLLNPVSAVTGLNSTAIPDMEFFVTNDEEFLVWGNGINPNLKFEGSAWTNLSLPQATAPSGVDDGAGTLGAGDYYYYVSFARTVAGVIVEEGELSDASAVVTIAGSHKILVTIPLCVESLATGVTAQCNARILYRESPTSMGVVYRHAVIADNVTTTYGDNTLADGTIEADFTNQASPVSAIFEENFGCMYFVDADRPTDLYESKAGKPWTCDAENFEIYDGPIKCVKRIYGVMFIGTDRSIWVKTGRNADAEAQRISSVVGILNNRCADGLSYLYFVATNYKAYKIMPTSFGFEQVRLDESLSDKVQSLFGDISPALSDKVCTKYYTTADVSKFMTGAPISGAENDSLIIYNETQSVATKDSVWQFWDNNKPSTLQMFTISGVANLYAQDANGFIWKLDDTSTNGDGDEINSEATATTATTLSDSTQTWVVNEHIGKTVRILSGDADGQSKTIISNTATQLTVTTWDDTPAIGDEYTIGGYDASHFTNWKSVTGSYDTLKQMWFFISNMNASGDYPIDLIIQFDFDETLSNSIVLNINLQSANSIWGDFLWGDAIWGAYSVFQDRIRQGGRFRAVRFGFMNRKAGQPFQCNGFSVSCQDKKLFYRGVS